VNNPRASYPARRAVSLIGAVVVAGLLIMNPAMMRSALAATTTYDNTGAWNGSSYGFPFGSCGFGTQNYGETITAPSLNTNLTSFTFYMKQSTAIIFRGEVYAWDPVNGHATGPQLFESAPMSTTNSAIFQAITFNILGGAYLNPGQQYILFATTDRDIQPPVGGGQWGFIPGAAGYAGGHATYYNTCTFSDTTTNTWDGQGNSYYTGGEWAFKAVFNSNVPAPTPTGNNVPYVAANSLTPDTHHFISFVARYRSYAPIGYRGDLNYQDYTATGTGCDIAVDALGICTHPGPNAGYCSNYAASSTNPAYCHLTVLSIVCPNGIGGASVYGTWSEPNTGVMHAYHIDVSTGSPGSFTIYTTTAGGAGYTSTVAVNANIQCS
jgi:hypothetical protein